MGQVSDEVSDVLRLSLGLEAPVTTPNSVNFLFFSFQMSLARPENRKVLTDTLLRNKVSIL